MNNHGITIYFINEAHAKTGLKTYTTNSIENAIKLFYRDYANDYKILNITE